MNEIVKSQNVIQSMDDVERAASAMSKSGFFPDSKQAAQAIVKVLAGRELGFGAFASMVGVSVIQGKPVIGANLLAAAVKQTGKYNYRVTTHTSEVCEIVFYEGKESVGTSTFTMKDASAAGLSQKDNWKKYPRNMLFARAIANGQKWFAPDVFNGVTVYTPDEMGATVNEDGDIVDVQATDAESEISDKLWNRFIEVYNKAKELGIEAVVRNREDYTKESLNAYGKELADAIKQIEAQNKAGA